MVIRSRMRFPSASCVILDSNGWQICLEAEVEHCRNPLFTQGAHVFRGCSRPPKTRNNIYRLEDIDSVRREESSRENTFERISSARMQIRISNSELDGGDPLVSDSMKKKKASPRFFAYFSIFGWNQIYVSTPRKLRRNFLFPVLNATRFSSRFHSWNETPFCFI